MLSRENDTEQMDGFHKGEAIRRRKERDKFPERTGALFPKRMAAVGKGGDRKSVV